jgi:hypothetical protein
LDDPVVDHWHEVHEQMDDRKRIDPASFDLESIN